MYPGGGGAARRCGDGILLIDLVDISAEVDAREINSCRDRQAGVAGGGISSRQAAGV